MKTIFIMRRLILLLSVIIMLTSCSVVKELMFEIMENASN